MERLEQSQHGCIPLAAAVHDVFKGDSSAVLALVTAGVLHITASPEQAAGKTKLAIHALARHSTRSKNADTCSTAY
jgi:hypothetical protein